MSSAVQAEERIVRSAIARGIFAPPRGTLSSRISRTLRHPSGRVVASRRVGSITVPHGKRPGLFLFLWPPDIRSLFPVVEWLSDETGNVSQIPIEPRVYRETTNCSPDGVKR